MYTLHSKVVERQISKFKYMDYQKIYDAFILSRRSRELDSSIYYEQHHIIPLCIGGSDDKDNLIYLTAREHLFAHIVLTEIYPKEISIKYAVVAMCGFKNVGNRYLDLKFLKTISTKLVSKIREDAIHSKKSEVTKQKLREMRLGEKNPMFGRKHSEQSKKLMSENLSGKNHWMFGKHWSDEYRKNRERILKSRPKTNRIFTEEHRKHISESRLGKFKEKDNPFFGKHHTEKKRKKLSIIAMNRKKKMVVTSEGKLLSVTEAKELYKVTDSTIRYWANNSHKNGIYWSK